MKENQDKPADTAELRRLAEQRLNRERPEGGGQRTEAETARLVHELEVHQIELEMQNEELRRERAEAETLLTRYTDLYESAPVSYVTLDREGAIRQVNLTGARLLGVERSRIVNQHFGLFVAEADGRTFSDFLQRVFASQARESCEVMLPREGSPPLVLAILGTRSEDQQECRAVVLDITERKRAEADLGESEERFRRVFEEGPLGMVIASAGDGRFLRANAVFCQMLGYTEEELKRVTFDKVTHPEHRAADLDGVKRMRDGQIQRYQTEKRYVHKNSDSIWGAVTSSLIRDKDGKPLYFLAMVEDISESKRAEMTLRDSQARLNLAMRAANGKLGVRAGYRAV